MEVNFDPVWIASSVYVVRSSSKETKLDLKVPELGVIYDVGVCGLKGKDLRHEIIVTQGRIGRLDVPGTNIFGKPNPKREMLLEDWHTMIEQMSTYEGEDRPIPVTPWESISLRVRLARKGRPQRVVIRAHFLAPTFRG